MNSIRCGEDRTGDSTRKAPLEILRDLSRDSNQGAELSPLASHIKNEIATTWRFYQNIIERVIPGSGPQLTLFYRVTYFGRGASKESSVLDAVKKAIESYSVRIDSEALAEYQLRGLVFAEYGTDKYPMIDTSQEAQGGFVTKLITLEKKNVCGCNFEDAYGKMRNSEMEVRELIDRAARK